MIKKIIKGSYLFFRLVAAILNSPNPLLKLLFFRLRSGKWNVYFEIYRNSTADKYFIKIYIS